jgi:hypothetical protein
MAQQQAAPIYTQEDTIDVSIYPSAKREKHETNTESSVEPSAPTLNDLFPNINPTTISMFWYLTQTFSDLKELYDTYSLRMVLECINIHPFIWEKLDLFQQKKYLDIWVETEEYMKQHNF